MSLVLLFSVLPCCKRLNRREMWRKCQSNGSMIDTGYIEWCHRSGWWARGSTTMSRCSYVPNVPLQRCILARYTMLSTFIILLNKRTMFFFFNALFFCVLYIIHIARVRLINKNDVYCLNRNKNRSSFFSLSPSQKEVIFFLHVILFWCTNSIAKRW